MAHQDQACWQPKHKFYEKGDQIQRNQFTSVISNRDGDLNGFVQPDTSLNQTVHQGLLVIGKAILSGQSLNSQVDYVFPYRYLFLHLYPLVYVFSHISAYNLFIVQRTLRVQARPHCPWRLSRLTIRSFAQSRLCQLLMVHIHSRVGLLRSTHHWHTSVSLILSVCEPICIKKSQLSVIFASCRLLNLVPCMNWWCKIVQYFVIVGLLTKGKWVANGSCRHIIFIQNKHFLVLIN